MMTGDAALVERLKRDDEGAMREVYEAYHPQMMDFAERMGTARADAGDAVNDVFLELCRGVGRFTRRRRSRWSCSAR